MHVKAKGDDGGAAMDAMLEAAKGAADGGALTLGHLPKDQHTGALADLWASKLAASGAATADAGAGLAELFGAKDDAEVLNVKKAAFLASKVAAHVVAQIEEAIDQEKAVKHSKLSGAPNRP